MIKRIHTLSILFFLPIVMLANPIDRQTATQTATQTFKAIRPGTPQLTPVVLCSQAKSRIGGTATEETPEFYAFNSTDGQGFVIISGDDRFPMLVGYSDNGSLSSADELPPGLQDFLGGYATYVDRVRSGKAEAPARHIVGDKTGEDVVAPMLTCTWNQDSPYNYYCPNQWPVGCVATAMSQIMYYWKYPSTGKGKITYSAAGSNITVDFTESNYDWSIMKDKFSAMDWKKDAGKNVAKLCLDCGVACYMDYNQSGSGATIVDAYNAMFTNFGYDAEAMTLLLRRATETQEEWNALLFAELDAGRPVLYAGVSSTGGGSDASGHAFVLDGYDSNYFPHVNWGWGGSSNGWYDITLLNPGGYTFSESQEMVIGIQPDPEGLHTQRKQFRMLMTDPLQPSKSSTAKQGSNISLQVGGIYNHATYAGTYTLGIMLYDRQGQRVEDVTVTSSNLTVTLSSMYGRNPFGNVRCNVPVSMADGYYYLSLETQEKGFNDYVKPYTYGGDVNNRLWISVHDGQVDLGVDPPAALPGDVNGDGTVDINDVVAVINHIAGTASYDRANVNGDTDTDGLPLVDINDVVAVINIMAQ